MDRLRSLCRRRRSGVSLVEAVIALGLLALVMGAAYPVMIQASRIGRVARNHYIAVALAQNRMERARTLSYADLRYLTESNVVVNDLGTPISDGNFRRTTSITTNVAFNVSRFTVTVDIRNMKSRQFLGESESLSTCLTQYEVRP